ncbi:NUDIX hydrolase [Pantoea vagans]|uniref:NUDIX hydrolase n=1 Tax=Pantoea vagans TaxID=470934 RepID=UPI0023B20590|nr:NUDIX domain-containing protein [Pantoea vagans]MDE8559260.1 NUDIX domain-containing protein [Pantoea vagans]MDE8579260.1 NUDIX domain-containing protein [Pantoea vagans]
MSYVKHIRSMIGHQLLLLAGANVIILDKHQNVLLQLRTDGSWGLPGGLLEPGESLEQTAIREVKEETNIDIHKLHHLKVFSGPEYTFTLKNKDVINVITSLYYSADWSGEIINDPEEGLALEFFSLNNLPESMDEEYLYYLRYYRERK